MSDNPNTDDELLDEDALQDDEADLEGIVADEFDLGDLRTDTIDAAQTEGLALAYETATAIMRDPKSSPLARVAAMKVVVEIGKQKGRDRERRIIKPEDETPEEFEQRYAEARHHLAQVTNKAAAQQQVGQPAKPRKSKPPKPGSSLFD